MPVKEARMLDKAVSIAMKLGLPYVRNAAHVLAEGTPFAGDHQAHVVVRSNLSSNFHYAMIGATGLYALGEEQGNYAGGIYGRLNDPAFPIRVYHIGSLPHELRQFLWELEPELLSQPLRPLLNA